jgi:hypothetical protein
MPGKSISPVTASSRSGKRSASAVHHAGSVTNVMAAEGLLGLGMGKLG